MQLKIEKIKGCTQNVLNFTEFQAVDKHGNKKILAHNEGAALKSSHWSYDVSEVSTGFSPQFLCVSGQAGGEVVGVG